MRSKITRYSFGVLILIGLIVPIVFSKCNCNHKPEDAIESTHIPIEAQAMALFDSGKLIVVEIVVSVLILVQRISI